MINTNFDDLARQLAARRDQLQAEIDAAMDAHGVICRAHDLLAGTATIVTAKAAEASAFCRVTTTRWPNTYTCTREANHLGDHVAKSAQGAVIASWPRRDITTQIPCGNELGGSSGLACGLVVGHTGPHQAFDGSNEATAVWSA